MMDDLETMADGLYIHKYNVRIRSIKHVQLDVNYVLTDDVMLVLRNIP